MLTCTWCVQYIIGDNDLFIQNDGFSPSSLLDKVRLIVCNQRWLIDNDLRFNLTVDAHGSSGRVNGLFILNRNIFNYNIF